MTREMIDVLQKARLEASTGFARLILGQDGVPQRLIEIVQGAALGGIAHREEGDGLFI